MEGRRHRCYGSALVSYSNRYKLNHFVEDFSLCSSGSQFAGALMVITLKIISCVINYNDGMLKEEDLREAQKKNRLLKLPSIIEYFGYCLCCGSHFAGPVYEMKDYLEWTERKGVLYFCSYVNFLPVLYICINFY